ncbi:DUF5335 family protein [Actinophytocola sp.]|jgi:hypothetical protein|uniref:DUF5335 family protein n=1 Tax=Actinophytocola sp. TaxID=1872138 RepID=UPI002EDB1D83
MADTGTLNRNEWLAAFDRMTSDHEGDEVTIEVLDPTIGYEPEAERMPFSYLNYDPKDDVVIVAVGGRTPRYPVVLRHIVYRPSRVDIAVDEVPQPAVRVVEEDGTTTLVTFFPAAAS